MSVPEQDRMLFETYQSVRKIFHQKLLPKDGLTDVYHCGILADQTFIQIYHPPETQSIDDTFLISADEIQITSPELYWTAFRVSKRGLESVQTTDLRILPNNISLPLQAGILGKVLILKRNDYPDHEKAAFSNFAIEYVSWIGNIIHVNNYLRPPFPFKKFPS